MKQTNGTIFQGKKILITNGQFKGKIGIFVSIVEFYDDTKKNALCKIIFEGETLQIREEDFRFADELMQQIWEFGDVLVETT